MESYGSEVNIIYDITLTAYRVYNCKNSRILIWPYNILTASLPHEGYSCAPS